MKKELLILNEIRLFRQGHHIDHFGLYLYEGDVYGILCEKQETKNALAAMFLGKYPIASGRISVGGQRMSGMEFARWLRRSVMVIGQRPRLIPVFSISENICMLSGLGKRNYKKTFRAATEVLIEEFGLNLNPDQRPDTLSDKERIQVEMLSAYMMERKLLVLVGLYGILQRTELEEIHRLACEMQRRRPELCLCMIDQPCDAVLDWTSKVQILKGRTNYGYFLTEEMGRNRIYSFYANREDDADDKIRPSEFEASVGTDFLLKKSLTGEGMKGVPGEISEEEEAEDTEDYFICEHVSTSQITELDLYLTRGELFKIYCMDSESLHGLRNLFMGEAQILQGQMQMDEKPLQIHSLRQLRKHRICYCREHAYDTMLIPDLTVRENILLDVAVKTEELLLRSSHVQSVDDFIYREFGRDISNLRPAELTIEERQRLVFLKIYMNAPKVLIVERPFYDVDIRTAQLTIKLMHRMTERGIIVVLLTMSLESVREIDGDILYMMQGRAVDEEEIYRALYPG